MDFQSFKYDLEIRLSWKQQTFSLHEFHYHGYAFGSGILAYNIKEHAYKLIYDGRDFMLSIERSGLNEKYPNCKWIKIIDLKNLDEATMKKVVEILIS